MGILLIVALTSLSPSEHARARGPGPAAADEEDEQPTRFRFSPSLQIGLGFGGEPLGDVPKPEPKSGDGVFLGLGLLAVPLWTDGGTGIGLSAEGGFKYASSQSVNGSLSLERFAVTGMPQLLLDLGDGALLSLGVGPTFEFGLVWSGRGSLSGESPIELDDALGATAKVGAMYVTGAFALSLELRCTWLTYEGERPGAERVDADADHTTLGVGLHYAL